MIKSILNSSSCAECRLCCIFDSYEIWETPVLDAETMDKIKKLDNEAEFYSFGNCFKMKISKEKLNENQMFLCPALDQKSGCRLGDHKPFECRIWPFRIMNFNGKRVIAIAPICPAIMKKPLNELVNFLNAGLAEKIFSYGDEHPEIIKDHDNSYPILIFEK